MKRIKPFIHELGPNGEAIFTLLTFCFVVGVLYWLIRAGCTIAFKAIVGH